MEWDRPMSSIPVVHRRLLPAVLRNKKVEVFDEHKGKADSDTWLKFLAWEKNIMWTLISRKIQLKGNPGLMKSFARCFPLSDIHIINKRVNN